MRRVLGLAAVVCGVAMTSDVTAQGAVARGYLFREPPVSLTLFGGLAQPGAGSEVFEFSYDELTLGRRDLRAFDYGADIAIRVGGRADLVLGFARSGRSHRSEFRDWVDNDDLPIEQTTRFERMPLSASLRYLLTPRGRHVGSIAWVPSNFVPWIGAGGGVMRYRFEQVGDFIDFETFDIFADRYTAEGWAPFVQGAAGAGWAFAPNWSIAGEVRYIHGRGELGSQFSGFDKLDLSGVSMMLGLTLRF